ncbi:hypothetical protein HGH92_24180 [Chitinophaga varians]|uniref:Uncharacterized protein n=1 Tax=Chitinophaga varians TaxID=2202339 RepID=A0A847RZH1_9BACT|nr:hypothetical protein [Chitinophaga varians]NLR67424.1 hypothetical protein [Chitinophaga varians]
MLLASGTVYAQQPSLDKPERTVAGVCLCYTTLDDLEKAGNALQPVKVTEMEYPEKALRPDSSYEYGKGYITARYPGMIFQTERNSRYITKIRLTPDFKGKLPDGKAIDVRCLKAADVLRMYPELVNRWMWMSRPGSDYLILSNSLIQFYVKKDYSRKPLYPIDDAYYRKKPIAGIDLVYGCHPAESGLDLTASANYYVDSVLVPDLDRVFASGNISRVTTLTHSTDKILVGSKGAIFIETKKFVRHRYWNIFSLDEAYRKLVPSPDADSGVIYILRGKPLSHQPESSLAEVTAETFASLVILDKAALKKQYGIKSRKPGVVVKLKGDK